MGAVRFLYGSALGRALLKPLTARSVSRFCGKLLDTGASKVLIPLFIRKAGIDTDDYDLSDIKSFNDFFRRPLKPGRRSVDPDPAALVAPCDGLLTAYAITEGTVLPVKQSSYTVASLLRDEALAEEFDGGLCLVYRLCVDNFHRYCWFDGGVKSESAFIPGVLHTVRPAALAKVPVFVENCREYCAVDTVSFGKAVQMEVGAMLVGRIENHLTGPGPVSRGEEKGWFSYGGSTVIVLLKKNAAVLREDVIKASARGEETPVRMGEAVGRKRQ